MMTYLHVWELAHVIQSVFIRVLIKLIFNSSQFSYVISWYSPTIKADIWNFVVKPIETSRDD
jgi:hypothetical protein